MADTTLHRYRVAGLDGPSRVEVVADPELV